MVGGRNCMAICLMSNLSASAVAADSSRGSRSTVPMQQADEQMVLIMKPVFGASMKAEPMMVPMDWPTIWPAP